MSVRSTAIVTGASSGIGKSIALMFKEQGYDVIGIARHFDEDLPFVTIAADITDYDIFLPEYRKIIKDHHPEVLVNCAGVGYYGLHEDISASDISYMVRTDLEAPMILTSEILRDMKQHKRGTIINISSVVSSKSSTYAAAYAAAKAGLSSFSGSIFEESRKHGIIVTDICPDMTKSNFYRNADFTEDDDPEAYLLPEDVADAVKNVIMARDGVAVTQLYIRPRYHRVKRRKES